MHSPTRFIIERPPKKFVQNVKHLKDVPKSKYADEYCVQVKKDGNCAQLIIYDGVAQLYTRENKRFTNVELLESFYTENNIPDGCYRAELCCDSVALEVLSGYVSPNRVQPVEETLSLYLAFFDFIPLPDFIAGACPNRFSERQEELNKRLVLRPGDVILPYVRVPRSKLNSLSDSVTRRGEEGIVGYVDTDWQAGHKGWRTVKIVNVVSYDLECVGIEEGEGKYKGKAANLLFRWRDGVTIPVMLGKGYTHEDAEMYFNNPPIGKIFEVSALSESSKGVLRLPKVKRERYDKSTTDF